MTVPVCSAETLEIHQHTADCYDSDGNLTCGYANFVVHRHDSTCYDENGNLWCPLPEIEAHQHTDSCYTQPDEPVDPVLICEKPEVTLHEHNADCFRDDGYLICEMLEVLEHQHTDACFETVEESVDTETLTCTLPEDENHAHIALCYGTWVLTCELEEHTHTEDCYPQEASAVYGIMLLDGETDGKLPVAKLSGNETKYNPATDQFTTKVRIDFQFTAETGRPTAGTVYTYTYPKGITVPDDIVNKDAQNLYDGDKLAGTYQFIKNEDGTYSVQVIFNENYVNESGDTVTGYVQFEGSFSKEDMNDKGDIVVGGDGAVVLVPGEDITYPKDETERYNIDVRKSGSWVQDGDKLVYTVYIRTTKGTPDPISFTDTITCDGLTLGEPVVTIEKGTSDYYLSWNGTWTPNDQNDWSEVSGIEHTNGNGELTLMLSKLSTEEKTDSNYTYITGEVYKITYTYPITAQTVAVVSPKNKATVTAKDETKGQTVTDSAEITVNVNKDFSYTLDKYGQVASDKPGYIKWTVTVNNNEQDIAGAKLADGMLGLVEDTAKDIVIYPAEGATVTKDENGKITDITFTATENGVNKNKYTITYYTPVKESWDGTTVTNKAAFDPTPGDDGDEKEVTASVTVSGVQLNKWGQFNGATNKIDWTITVNAGNLDIAGATLTDEMFAALSETDFTIEPSTGYSFTKDTDGKITGITFTEVEDGKNTQSYTIKYSTAVTENENGTTSPVTNSATLSPGEGKEGTPIGSESTVKPDEIQLTKSGRYTWDKKISWTITVNASKLNIAGAVLTDEMFSRLTASDITIQKNGGTPDSSEYTVDVDENGKITSITFNATEENSVNTNQYTITYTTDEPQAWNDKTVHNQAKLTLDGKETPGTADVTVPGDGSVAKSVGTGTVSDDGTAMTIPWTVTLTIPKGGLPAGTTIVDDVTKNQWGNTNTNQWMTRSQITAWATNLTWTDNNGNPVGGTNTYNPPPEQVTFLASDGNTYTFKQINEYKAPAGEEGVNYEALTYTLFTIHFPEGLIPPEGATRLTFTYSTTVDLTKATTGGNKFYNDIQVGGKETGTEYTYYKPGVVKTDGNGSTDTTTVSNEGELTWKVKATVGEGNKKLTLIDTLPEGVTLESLRLTGWGNLNMELTVGEDGTISGTDSTNQYTVSGTYQDRVITLNIEPKTEGNTIQTGAEFTLIVTCQVDNAENQSESKTLTNTAKMKLDGGEIGSSNQTQEWTYQKEEVVTQVVNKSGGWDNTNRIMNYTVILNPEGNDILEGSDTLTLVDTMSYKNQFTLYHPFTGTYNINAALIQSSVKLYEATWDEAQGKWVAGEPVTGWSWTYEAKTGENSWDLHDATNTITATGIPDGTPLMLQYSYRVTCNVPDEINGQKTYFDLKFSNTAKLEGTDHSGEHSSSNTKWEHSSDSAGVTTDKSYTFYKVEAGNYNVSLAGATFSVYKYDTSTSEYGTEPVKTYSTNASGSFQITRQEKDASGNVTFNYDTNTLYKVTETAPPEGYRLPDEVKTFYFYFSSTEDTVHTLPNNLPSDAVDLTNEARTVYVENVKNTTEITVEKKWKDANNNDVTATKGSTISFDLYQIASTTPPGGGGSGEGETGTTTGVSYVAECNSSIIITGTFSDVAVGDTVKVSVDYTWQASLYSVAPSEWSGVSDGTGEYANNGYTYEYTCKIMSSTISFKTGDREESIRSIRCTLVEAGTSSNPDSSGSGDGEETTDPTPTEPAGTYINTYTISNTDGWTWSKDDLPLTGTDKDNNTIYYTYYVVEHSGANYSTSYENNGGISSGTITIKNTESDTPVYELPETGGPGTTLYSAGGLLLMAAAGRLLLHKRKKRRKEDSASS
ncbi:SpaA isopeptide-forming pilin-related protein [Anaeromassilibacillus senegalensis]|uniref:LPXTG cell wall anchor domain-containing protein n=1 Tax=Anaeromassilibacillus senegalensis TaxID=1673717 RepID=A0ABS9CIL5_9FIRM|nr:SpaA isopeptide-forming pilin-related protein [Anaeromassilibacillus senegalensis]MCF2650994.1 LPXTG cell wall anchor domain-containing protein [Anaeromassilibacillus senegalensis]